MSDSVGSVSVDVVPDARGWSEKLRAQIRNQSVEVKADAETEEANAKIDEVARDRTSTIKVRSDTSQLSQIDDFIGKLGLLPALAIAGSSALVPLGAALVGVTAALATPLAIAGGGATLFGLLAGAAVAQTNKQLKVIDSLQKKLDGLTKGTAEYAATQKELRDATKALSPEQTKFQSSISKLGAAFQNFLNGKSGSQLLSVVNQGIGLLIKLLPLAAPLITAVGVAFKTLLGELSDGAGSQGFAEFVNKLAHRVGPDLIAFGHIFGNTIKGLTGILLAFGAAFNNAGPGGFLHGLEQLSGRFADLGAGAGHSKWLKDFIDYVHQVGPQVASTLGSLARAFGHIVSALAPLGPPVLHIIQGIADAISGIPTGTLTLLASTAAQLVVFQKLGGFKALSFLGRGGLGGGGLLGGIAGAAKPVPVFVTNPGFGGPGGVGGPGGGGVGGVVGGVAAGTAAATARTGGILSDLGISRILAGLAPRAGGALLGVTAGDIGNEVLPAPHMLHGQMSSPSAFLNQYGPNADGVGGSVVPRADILKLYGLSHSDARGLLGIPEIRSTGTAFDALKAHAQSASRQIDMIGPHAKNTFDSASADVAHFNGVLNSIHDKRIKVIAETADAIASLNRLQALRIADKHFTVYQRFQLIEQGVGPGGGMGRPNPGGSAGGGASKGSGSGASTGPTHVHVHLDDGSGRTLHGVISDGADQVYHANRAYEYARAGR